MARKEARSGRWCIFPGSEAIKSLFFLRILTNEGSLKARSNIHTKITIIGTNFDKYIYF